MQTFLIWVLALVVVGLILHKMYDPNQWRPIDTAERKQGIRIMLGGYRAVPDPLVPAKLKWQWFESIGFWGMTTWQLEHQQFHVDDEEDRMLQSGCRITHWRPVIRPPLIPKTK